LLAFSRVRRSLIEIVYGLRMRLRGTKMPEWIKHTAFVCVLAVAVVAIFAIY
jgi:hypothetical protein